MTRLSCSIRSPSRLNFRGVNSRIWSLNFFTDLGRMRRERLERVKPKKAYPFAKEVSFVAAIQSLTVPCPPRHRTLTTVLRVIPASGDYSRSADIPLTCRAGDGFADSPRQEPFRRCLIDSFYPAADRRDDVGLHRLDETPLSPNDSAAHRNSWRG